jgi:L-threonylcarbamoyladenylate synthase
VRLFDAASLAGMLSPGKAAGRPEGLAVYSRTVPAGAAEGVRWHRAMPLQAAPAAQELFSVLRELDAQGAQQIWVETPPDTPEWEGVRDRLRRAAA